MPKITPFISRFSKVAQEEVCRFSQARQEGRFYSSPLVRLLGLERLYYMDPLPSYSKCLIRYSRFHPSDPPVQTVSSSEVDLSSYLGPHVLSIIGGLIERDPFYFVSLYEAGSRYSTALHSAARQVNVAATRWVSLRDVNRASFCGTEYSSYAQLLKELKKWSSLPLVISGRRIHSRVCKSMRAIARSTDIGVIVARSVRHVFYPNTDKNIFYQYKSTYIKTSSSISVKSFSSYPIHIYRPNRSTLFSPIFRPRSSWKKVTTYKSGLPTMSMGAIVPSGSICASDQDLSFYVRGSSKSRFTLAPVGPVFISRGPLFSCHNPYSFYSATPLGHDSYEKRQLFATDSPSLPGGQALATADSIQSGQAHFEFDLSRDLHTPHHLSIAEEIIGLATFFPVLLLDLKKNINLVLKQISLSLPLVDDFLSSLDPASQGVAPLRNFRDSIQGLQEALHDLEAARLSLKELLVYRS